ncbi:undecaprenyl-diphosphate phosphatase [Streptomyces mirabilis]|uniref:undecaprenyl-diphosphate phosphatase n=1 Tax=Streptomyces mirabilis TaxID=68239 RepID=UPI0033B6B60C
MLFITEQLWRGGTGRRRAGASTVAGEEQRTPDELSDQRITGMTMRQAMAIGVAQILALLPGTSRSGSTIGAGIFRGLNREDSARFAFLLATPVIGGAALLKPPPLLGSQGNDLRGPHGFAILDDRAGVVLAGGVRGASEGEAVRHEGAAARGASLQTGTRRVHLPENYANWRGIYNRMRMRAIDRTWQRVCIALMAQADADEDPNWAGGLHHRADAPVSRLGRLEGNRFDPLAVVPPPAIPLRRPVREQRFDPRPPPVSQRHTRTNDRRARLGPAPLVRSSALCGVAVHPVQDVINGNLGQQE